MEAILICIILTSIAITFSKRSTSDGFLTSLIEGPWLNIRGMIEDGVWAKAGKDSKSQNPQFRKRHGTFEGDIVPKS